MIIKGLTCEDFLQYKKPSMFIIFPHCSFKCDKEFGVNICQNWALSKEPNIDVQIETIVKSYLNNPITHAIVCGGLEPFDSWNELLELIREFRQVTEDDIVIYTGYREDEIEDKITILKHDNISNIIIKFGRYRPNETPHYDQVLGVYLASDNQYAIKFNNIIQ